MLTTNGFVFHCNDVLLELDDVVFVYDVVLLLVFVDVDFVVRLLLSKLVLKWVELLLDFL